MPTVVWLGGTSTDVGVGANWVGGSVPASGDTAVWNSVTTYGMGSGTFTNPVFLVVTEGAGTATSRDVGTAASPLTLSITATTGTARFANRGNVYVTSGGTVAFATFEMPNNATAVLSGGTWTNATFVGVQAEVGASAVLVNVNSIGSVGNVATNATDVTNFTGSGRWTFNSRDLDEIELLTGANFTVAGTSAVDTYVRIGSNARFNHKSSGTVASGTIRPGGIYTVDGNPSSAAILSLATIWSGGQLIESVPGFTLTVTARAFVGTQSASETPLG